MDEAAKRQMLGEARTRALKLLAQLRHHERDLLANPEKLTPEQHAEGLRRIRAAVDATERLLQSIGPE